MSKLTYCCFSDTTLTVSILVLLADVFFFCIPCDVVVVLTFLIDSESLALILRK